jgi:hypothetical protein
VIVPPSGYGRIRNHSFCFIGQRSIMGSLYLLPSWRSASLKERIRRLLKICVTLSNKAGYLFIARTCWGYLIEMKRYAYVGSHFIIRSRHFDLMLVVLFWLTTVFCSLQRRSWPTTPTAPPNVMSRGKGKLVPQVHLPPPFLCPYLSRSALPEWLLPLLFLLGPHLLLAGSLQLGSQCHLLLGLR